MMFVLAEEDEKEKKSTTEKCEPQKAKQKTKNAFHNRRRREFS
jgi:hypothetical protein